MFERFTNLAKRSITLAQDEAMQLGHDFIGTGHLLLGLARVTSGVAGQVLSEQGVSPDQARGATARMLAAAGIAGTASQDAADALATIGIDVEEIRRRADDAFGPGRFRFPRPAFTPRAKRALGLALGEAQALGHDYIGTEHLLLGLLTDAEADGEPGQCGGASGAVRVLTALGADPAALRQAVLARVTAPAT